MIVMNIVRDHDGSVVVSATLHDYARRPSGSWELLRCSVPAVSRGSARDGLAVVLRAVLAELQEGDGSTPPPTA